MERRVNDDHSPAKGRNPGRQSKRSPLEAFVNVCDGIFKYVRISLRPF